MSQNEEYRKSIKGCPTGCSLDEIEIGKEGQSAMAIFGSPFQHLRCGNCDFNAYTPHVKLAHNIPDCIKNWNEAVESYYSSQEEELAVQ